MNDRHLVLAMTRASTLSRTAPKVSRKKAAPWSGVDACSAASRDPKLVALSVASPTYAERKRREQHDSVDKR